MNEQTAEAEAEVYEPPALVEVGDFAEVTLGFAGYLSDGQAYFGIG